MKVDSVAEEAKEAEDLAELLIEEAEEIEAIVVVVEIVEIEEIEEISEEEATMISTTDQPNTIENLMNLAVASEVAEAVDLQEGLM